jgi:hypothetical protein
LTGEEYALDELISALLMLRKVVFVLMSIALGVSLGAGLLLSVVLNASTLGDLIVLLPPACGFVFGMLLCDFVLRRFSAAFIGASNEELKKVDLVVAHWFSTALWSVAALSLAVAFVEGLIGPPLYGVYALMVLATLVVPLRLSVYWLVARKQLSLLRRSNITP